MNRSTTRRSAQGLWWISPLGAMSLLVPPTLWLTHRLSDADFQLFYRTPKSVTAGNLVLVAVAALVSGGVALLVSRLSPVANRQSSLLTDRPVPRRLGAAARVLFWLTMVGYAAYFGSGFARGVTPGVLVEALISQDTYGADLKESFGGIAGVTTLTQCGIAFVVLAAYLLRRERTASLIAQLVLVLLLTLVRSFAASERLALIEVAVPAVAVLAMSARNSRRPVRRLVARIAPIVLAPLVLLIFAAFEYSRSWQFFRTRTDEPFALFALIRFAGYYATAYNNGYVEMQYGTFPGRLPLDSLAALWNAPVIASLGLYDRFSAPVPATSDNLLERFASPEFNNPGGLTTPFVDFGLVGGFAFFVLLGVVLGLLYRSFRNGTVWGALLYPVALIGLFDLPRYLYWTQGRVVPAWVCLIVVALVLVRDDRQQRTRRALSPHPTVRPELSPAASPVLTPTGPRPR